MNSRYCSTRAKTEILLKSTFWRRARSSKRSSGPSNPSTSTTKEPSSPASPSFSSKDKSNEECSRSRTFSGVDLELCRECADAASPAVSPQLPSTAFRTDRREPSAGQILAGSSSVLGHEAIASAALDFLAQSGCLIPRGQSADPDTVHGLVAEHGLVDRRMETRQFPAKLFHKTHLNVPRLLFGSRRRELHRERSGCHMRRFGDRCLTLCVGDLHALGLRGKGVGRLWRRRHAGRRFRSRRLGVGSRDRASRRLQGCRGLRRRIVWQKRAVGPDRDGFYLFRFDQASNSGWLGRRLGLNL